MLSIKSKVCILVTSAVIFAQASCKKYEPEPLNVLTEDVIYDQMDINGYYAEQVLNNLYSYLPTGFNRIDGVLLAAATDDAVASENSNDIENISQAKQNPVNSIDPSWSDGYQAIRKVNLFLSKIDRVPVAMDKKVYWKAEARFIRAMSYFELIKRYGGVPLLGDRILSINDNINIPRNSFEECVQYLSNELDAISGQLRKETGVLNDVNFGHITEGASLALKSRLLLYAASPLHNPASDLRKWQLAYDAAKQVIDLNVYDLHPSFSALFTTRKNKEIILAYQQARSQSIERANAPIGYISPNASNGAMSPSQELVNAFPMKTGVAINAPGSGYVATNPYANRDPRFNASIFFNGALWLQRPVETFDGGLDRPGGFITQTRTGYYMRKFMGDFSAVSAYSNQDHNFIIFRYAEILLNLAEAANELGNTAEALTQLKALRARAGITAGTGSVLYGLKAVMTKDEMREAVMLERRIELAFEEHRFWDVRRWKIADTALNKVLHGVQITKLGNIINYKEVEVAPIRFIAPKMYLYPLPYYETLKNTSLVQNPGWGS